MSEETECDKHLWATIERTIDNFRGTTFYHPALPLIKKVTQGVVKHYHSDIQIDIAWIVEHKPAYFAYGVRDCGTHIYGSSNEWVRAINEVYGGSITWYFYINENIHVTTYEQIVRAFQNLKSGHTRDLELHYWDSLPAI